MTGQTTQLPNNLLSSTPAEDEALDALRQQIDAIFREHATARLVGPDGETVDLPVSAFQALRLVVEAMAQGRTLTLVPHARELTSQEAADILHVSRPHLVKLLDDGEIPHYKVGTHRRIRLEDVLEYRGRRAVTRGEKLDELAQHSEQLEGGYK